MADDKRMDTIPFACDRQHGAPAAWTTRASRGSWPRMCAGYWTFSIRQNLAELDEDEKGVCKYIHPRCRSTANDYRLRIRPVFPLVFRSRKPEAKRFRKWFTAEVLPQAAQEGDDVKPGAVFGGCRRAGAGPRGCGPDCAGAWCWPCAWPGWTTAAAMRPVRQVRGDFHPALGGEDSGTGKLFRPPCRHPGNRPHVRGGLPCPGPGRKEARRCITEGLSAWAGRDAG